MIYIHPSLKRVLMRKTCRATFDIVYNIISYCTNTVMNHCNKNKIKRLN